MASIGSVMVQIGLNVNDFQRGLSRAESAMQKAGDTFTSIGTGMAKALTVPLTAIGGVALSSASMVGESQSLIQAQLGVTSEVAENLQGVVNDIFKDGLGGDMSEVQNTVTTVVRNMKTLEGASDEMVEKVAVNTLNLSKAFGADSGEVSRAVNALQQSFEGLDTDVAFDNITKGFQNGLDYSGEFLDTINEYSVHFEKMGFSANDMFGFFNAGAEAGVFQLDKVGDLVKEMNIRFSDNTAGEHMKDLSKETQALYKNYQKTGNGGEQVFQSVMKDLDGMKDKQKAYNLGVALMGTQFEDLDQKAVSALANIEGGFEGAGGSMDALNGSVNNGLGVTLTSAFRSIQMALLPLGEELANLVSKYLPPVIKKIEELSEWFTGLSDDSKLAVLGVAGFSAVFPMILIGVGMLASAISKIMGVFGTVVKVAKGIFKVFKKLKTAMNFAKILPLITSPVGLIIAGILALIAVGVLIWKNWETIKEKSSEIWGSITKYFSDTWESISTGVTGFLTKIGDWFAEKWNSIATTTSEVFNSIVDFLVEWGVKLFNATPIGMFVGLIVDNWDFIRDTTIYTFEMLRDILGAIWSKIVEIVSPIISSIVDFISEKWQLVKLFVLNVMVSIKDFLVKIWNGILGFLVPIVTKIWNTVKVAWDKVSSVTSSIFNKVKDKVSTVFNAMKAIVSTVVGKIRDKVKEKFDSAKKAITEPIEDAKNKVKKMLDEIKGFFSGLKLELPMPKMPKFSVKKGKEKFLGKEITVPKFDVSWNAKGAIFNGATVLGGGQGVGEAGAEVVMPIQHKRYMKPFASNIASHLKGMKDESSSQGVTNNFEIAQLVVREDADVKKIATELQRIQRKEQRASGTLSFA